METRGGGLAWNSRARLDWIRLHWIIPARLNRIRLPWISPARLNWIRLPWISPARLNWNSRARPRRLRDLDQPILQAALPQRPAEPLDHGIVLARFTQADADPINAGSGFEATLPKAALFPN